MRFGLFKTVIVAVACSVIAMMPAGAQDVQERTIRWGHLNNPGNPISLGIRKYAEILAEKSGGKLKIREYPASQLGNEMQQQSALRGGTQEMFTSAPTSLVGIIKEFGLLDLPFSLSSLDGPFGQTLFSKLVEKDLVGLAYWDLGFRNVTNSRRPILRLEDIAGLKIRVIANPVYIETFGRLGANPVPMNFSELYTALETKAVDGQENPYSVILTSKLNEVQKYLSNSRHTYTTNLILVSKKFWDRLSPTEQRIMKEAAAESLSYQREVSRTQAQQAVTELQAKGMQYDELPPPEVERIRQVTRPVSEKFLAEYDPEIVRLFRAELERTKK
jgi:TRAP-type transport system periplasmic protein